MNSAISVIFAASVAFASAGNLAVPVAAPVGPVSYSSVYRTDAHPAAVIKTHTAYAAAPAVYAAPAPVLKTHAYAAPVHAVHAAPVHAVHAAPALYAAGHAAPVLKTHTAYGAAPVLL